jgi:hypothetical protein
MQSATERTKRGKALPSRARGKRESGIRDRERPASTEDHTTSAEHGKRLGEELFPMGRDKGKDEQKGKRIIKRGRKECVSGKAKPSGIVASSERLKGREDPPLTVECDK